MAEWSNELPLTAHCFSPRLDKNIITVHLVLFFHLLCRSAPMAEWSNELPLTAQCLSPLSGFKISSQYI